MNTVTDAFFTAVINEPQIALNLWLTRGVRPKTQRTDSDRVRPFIKLFDKLTEITSNDVDTWIEGLKGRLAYNSRVSHEESIRAFLNWCAKDNRIVLSASPITSPYPQRIKTARNKAANHQDILKLLRHLLQSSHTAANSRDLLAIQLYYDSACRMTEIATLTTTAMNRALRAGIKNDKGVIIYTAYADDGKKGSVPIRFTEYTACFYKQWLALRPKGTTNRIFTSLLHKNKATPINPEAMSNMIVRKCKQQNITPFRTHAIRHLKGTIVADKYGPAVAAALLNISFEVAQTHYYNGIETAVLNSSMDRASVFETEGWEFEPFRAY